VSPDYIAPMVAPNNQGRP